MKTKLKRLLIQERDKGNISNISLIVYDMKDYETIKKMLQQIKLRTGLKILLKVK